jgi:hypothetical protein
MKNRGFKDARDSDRRRKRENEGSAVPASRTSDTRERETWQRAHLQQTVRGAASATEAVRGPSAVHCAPLTVAE